MNTLTPAEPKVTQADRRAAASFYRAHLSRPGEVPVADHMLAGKIDESPLIKAFARHRLHTLASASAVPEGFALVPIEPTEAMIKAIWKSTLGGSMRSAERAALAMLSAALEPKDPNHD